MNIDKEAVFFRTKNEQEKQEGKGKGKVKKFYAVDAMVVSCLARVLKNIGNRG